MKDYDVFGVVSGSMSTAEYAASRLVDRLYVTRTFSLNFPSGSKDFGQPARYVHRVFNNYTDEMDPEGLDYGEDRLVVHETPAGRRHVTVQIAREAGGIRKLRIDRITKKASGEDTLERLIELDRNDAVKFIEHFKSIDSIPVEGETSAVIDDDVMRAVLADPALVSLVYQGDATAIRSLVQNDESATDIIAIANRRATVEHFRQLLYGPGVFERAVEESGGSDEKVWQVFFEQNPWIFGVGLSGQFLTSWDNGKLEKTVVGSSIAGVGKRTDALMQTNGMIQCMVLAEIKHHETELVEARPYRSGCYSPSRELVGGVTQIQQTVHRCVESLGSSIQNRDADGADLPGRTFLVAPRSYLIIGSLQSLCGQEGGVYEDRFRSFELYRRNLASPEVVTFDELLAKAEWIVNAHA